MNTRLLLFLILCALFGCNQTSNKIYISTSYDYENQYVTIRNNSTNYSYGFYNSYYSDLYINYGYKEPVYCIDSLNKLLYIYDIAPLRGIRIYDIDKDTLVKEIPIQFSTREHYNIKMFSLKDYFILKSNSRFIIWDKKFTREISLKDTIFSNYPICYRYTLDYVPVVKNDTLILSVDYEGGIIDTLIHTTHYIYDLSRNEFITKLEPCKKPLSKGID